MIEEILGTALNRHRCPFKTDSLEGQGLRELCSALCPGFLLIPLHLYIQ